MAATGSHTFDADSIVTGDVRVREIEAADGSRVFDVSAEASVTILSGGVPACGFHVEGHAQCDRVEDCDEATAKARDAARENCRRGARAYCDVHNGEA